MELKSKVLVIVAFFATSLSNVLSESSIYKNIGEIYLKSIHGVEQVEDLDYAKLKQDASFLKLPVLDSFTKKKIAFGICAENLQGKKNEVIEEALWKDLELFFGSAKNSSLHMFSKLDKTKTTFGQVSLARILVQPTTDVSFLNKRQEAIKNLTSNDDLFKQVDVLTTILKEKEGHLLSFWKEDSFVQELLFKKLYFNSQFLKEFNENPIALEVLRKLGVLTPLVPPLKKLAIFSAAKHFIYEPIMRFGRLLLLDNLEEANSYKKGDDTISKEFTSNMRGNSKRYRGRIDDPKELELNKNILRTGSYFVMDVDLDEDDVDTMVRKCCDKLNILRKYADKNSLTSEFFVNETKEFFKDVITLRDLKLIFDQILGIKDNLKKGIKAEKFPKKVEGFLQAGVGAIAAVIVLSEIIEMYPRVNGEKEKIALANYLQERLIHVARFFRSLNKLNQIIIINKPLFNGLEYKEMLGKLFGGFEARSEKLDQLIDILSKDTFKGEASYFSLTGRVLAAYKLLLEVKEELSPALEALGELDAYMSIARLYKEHENSKAKFSFANYIDAERPYILIKEFWNPFVDPSVVVTNNVELGVPGKAGNIILTGPNAGGKSTVLKGITMNILLAQTFGIAPSSEISITPFSKINTYLNITDDLAAGNSLFKAEVLRAQDLVNTIKHLPKKDFGFTIMDELFSGTSPKEGEAASYVVSRFLSEFNNSMCIIATHFPMLTELAVDTLGTFKNCKVSVNKNPDGSLAYSYRLEDGVSDQHIAFEILVNEGVLEDSILGEAQSLIKYIMNKYSKKFMP